MKPDRVHALLLLVLALIILSGCMGPAPRLRGEVGLGTHLWPMLEVSYEADGRDTDILWPLLAFNNRADHKYYALRPLFMIRTDPEDSVTHMDLLFPIFHTGLTGTRRELAMRPLLGMWRDAEKDMVDLDFLFPIGYWRSEPEKTWFHLRPFYWYKETPEEGYFHLFPFYGKNWEEKERRLWFLTPLFTCWKDWSSTPPDWSWSACWPLTCFERKGEESMSWIFPFYFKEHSPHSDTLAVTPFYWDHEGRSEEDPDKIESRTLMAFPLYGCHEGTLNWQAFGGNLLILVKGEEEGSVNVAWPLFHHGWKPEGTMTWIFPVYWHSRSTDEKRHLHHVWPLFGYRRIKDYREYSTLWPFFRYGSDGEDTTTLTLGGPLFSHSRESDNNWRWNVAWPLVRFDQEGSQYHSRIFPFYLHWRDVEKESRHLHLLWPLVRHMRSPRHGISFRLLMPYVTYEEKDEDHDFRVFWKWIRSSYDQGEAKLRINPFFRSDRNPRGDTYWSVLGGIVSRKQQAEDVEWKILWFIPL